MIPTAQRGVTDWLGGVSFPGMQSVSLRLEKFVRISEKARKENLKRDEILEVARRHGEFGRRITTIPAPPGACVFHARLGGRLIVNQAGGVLENAGLCLHRHFGDPFIPGSAVKGIARHSAWLEWVGANTDDRPVLADAIVKVFGNPSGDPTLDGFVAKHFPNIPTHLSGGVAFLPAVPVGKVQLVVDLVNCHHPKYYAGNQPDPTDNESPNPQFFPVVEQGVEFRFVLIPSARLGARSEELLNRTKDWLVRALTEQGAGAKTAAGYGWFAYSEEENRQREEAEARRVAEEARVHTEAEAKRRRESEAAAERESRRKEEEELGRLAPAERADRTVGKWDEGKWSSVLGQIQEFSKQDSDIRLALVRALAGYHVARWLALKETADKGKGKSKDRAREVRDAIYPLAKNATPRIKMP